MQRLLALHFSPNLAAFPPLTRRNETSALTANKIGGLQDIEFSPLDYPFYRLNAPIMGAPSPHRSKEMQTPAHRPGQKNGQAALASESPDHPLIIPRRRHKISTTCRGWEKMI